MLVGQDASLTIAEKRPPHVYGASSQPRRSILPHFETSPQHVYGASPPRRRNIIPHFETSTQHVYGTSSPHLRNFRPHVSGASCTMSAKRSPRVYGAFSPHRRHVIPHFETVPSARLRRILPASQTQEHPSPCLTSVLRTFTEDPPRIPKTVFRASQEHLSPCLTSVLRTMPEHPPRISETFLCAYQEHPQPCLTCILRTFTDHPPHIAGTSLPTSKHPLSTFTEHPPCISETFFRVSQEYIYIYIYIYGCSTVFGPLVFWYVPLQIQALVFTGLGRRHLSPDVFITSQWQQRSSCDPLRAAYIPKQKDTKT